MQDKMEMSFEEALTELEKVVLELEGGQLSLDESIACYEKGMRLSKICQQKLDESESKVAKLIGRQETLFEETDDDL